MKSGTGTCYRNCLSCSYSCTCTNRNGKCTTSPGCNCKVNYDRMGRCTGCNCYSSIRF